jgi:hypothetical protein
VPPFLNLCAVAWCHPQSARALRNRDQIGSILSAVSLDFTLILLQTKDETDV